MTRRLSSLAAAGLVACIAAAGIASQAFAQSAIEELGAETIDRDQPVALIADEVTYDTNTGRVTARGNVEVYYGDRTLTADEIVYDSRADRIEATGNIVLRDPAGATVYADLADLDAKLRDGLVRGARSVLGERAKLSAVEARRFEERYNALSKAVYSPCDVCEEDPTPLWRIRARKIIHDEEEKTIHYEHATLDVFGVPVAWVPYFQHPDPTVERASGFLVPSFQQSGNYGFGTKIPYYVVIDDRSDMTLTPFFTTEEGVIGEFEYRRVFGTGSFIFSGSVTRTDYTGESSFQGNVDTRGRFDADWLDEGARWGWDISTASDDAYLRRFDFSDNDILTSTVFVRNYWNDGFYDLTGLYFQSLRDNDPAGQIPRVLPEFEARREYADPYLGGEVGFFTATETLFRNNGRDVTRFSLGADWEREEILPVGLALRGFAELRGDVFIVEDDPTRGDFTSARFAPYAGIEARYPLIWEESDGDAAHVIEPIAQFVVAPTGGNGSKYPNEDSQQVEFDETNLFEVSRFSGYDGFEEGTRATFGMRYERVISEGVRVDGTLGRIFRFEDADEFGVGTGLSGMTSDWVGAWSVSLAPYLTVRQRMRVDGDFDINRNEVFADFEYGRVSLSAGYAFLEADPSTGSPSDREEVNALAGLQLTPEWRLSGFLQRDLIADAFVETGGAITFQNECCAVDLFVRRRFTDSDDAPASTSVGVQVRLLTIGTDQTLRRRDPLPRFTSPNLRNSEFAQMGGE
ncbi:LPS-assembly protein LptD [Limibaculum sp. M0105]|uniref:LPS-assembly protein LptD n=1 Tax=Thermohalobaculum xanthum TaxID=2753746 RepID=A0A8J7M6Y5_9RHOB|nr:LPS assembly protein LptD [Thermohalobaculum xanthum]MBK0398850.1 LPS-assembly protein LptD [Thermohalobaculum xanthum]